MAKMMFTDDQGVQYELLIALPPDCPPLPDGFYVLTPEAAQGQVQPWYDRQRDDEQEAWSPEELAEAQQAALAGQYYVAVNAEGTLLRSMPVAMLALGDVVRELADFLLQEHPDDANPTRPGEQPEGYHPTNDPVDPEQSPLFITRRQD